MTKTFNVGDHVSWNSEAGRVRGRILRVQATEPAPCRRLSPHTIARRIRSLEASPVVVIEDRTHRGHAPRLWPAEPED